MNRDEFNFFRTNGYYSYPKIIQIEITKACPFACKQCYKPQNGNVHMDYEQLKNFLLEIHGKCHDISLNGGEPLIYPHIYDLLNLIRELGFNTYLYSSGYGVDKDLCSLIDENRNLHFYVSLNGSTEEINGLSRQGYESAIEAIETMTEEGVDFSIVWVARHDNVRDFSNIIDLAFYYNIPYISVISNRLTGNGYIDSPLTKEDLEILAEIVRQKEARKPYILIDNCFSDLIVELQDYMKGIPMKCVAGISRFTVNSDFTYQPCTHLNYPERFNNIEDYWNYSEILKKIRNHDYKDGGLCNSCSHNKRCFPCRAANLAIYKNLDGYISECVSYLSDGRTMR